MYSPTRRSDRQAEPQESRLPPQPTGPRILVVEDTDALRASAVSTLSAEGYAVTEARHGLDALQVLDRASEPFDLVVTDVSMPVMTGYKLGRRLAESRPELPVIYMSNAPSEALVRCGLPAGPTSFLRKPFLPADLVREVAAVIPAHG
ncbi:MAG TPA: response regulator [Gemmatimonadales bacterium]|nr:response regulator [Gemmatimonadales bacterium]